MNWPMLHVVVDNVASPACDILAMDKESMDERRTCSMILERLRRSMTPPTRPPASLAVLIRLPPVTIVLDNGDVLNDC